MKLALYDDEFTFVTLPHDLVWTDEFDWVAMATTSEYSLTGALIRDEALKLSGRPITLAPPDNEMGWVSRATVKTLYEWANTTEIELLLSLEYATDTRTFKVTFAPTSEGAVLTAQPIKGFPGYEDGDWYSLSLKLMEIT
jgi:hypothetical protein